MAVITPYARFSLTFGSQGKQALTLEYARRSEEMPPCPSTIRHHPASVHAEMLASLMRESKEKVLVKFLAKDFSCIDSQLATRMVAERRTVLRSWSVATIGQLDWLINAMSERSSWLLLAKSWLLRKRNSLRSVRHWRNNVLLPRLLPLRTKT